MTVRRKSATERYAVVGSTVYVGTVKYRVAAVGVTGGERYYWLIDKHGVVAMMPADVVRGVR